MLNLPGLRDMTLSNYGTKRPKSRAERATRKIFLHFGQDMGTSNMGSALITYSNNSNILTAWTPPKRDAYLGESPAWGFPKIRGTSLGLPITRILIFLGLCWAPLFL